MSFEQNDYDKAGEQKDHLENNRQRSGRQGRETNKLPAAKRREKHPEVETATWIDQKPTHHTQIK